MGENSAIKAFTVQEEDEGTGGIVFAKTNVEARRKGSGLFGDGDFNWGKARRTPWADIYAPGPVPQLAMLDHGWWFHCLGCEVRISDDQTDDSGKPLHQNPIEVGSGLYCSAQCRARTLKDRVRRERVEDRAIAALKARLHRALPGTVPVGRPHAYVVKTRGRYAAKQVIVYFEFPGSKIGPATYRIDAIGAEPAVFVCGGDKAAWDAWRAPPPPVKEQGG